jgi:hypothetical protein
MKMLLREWEKRADDRLRLETSAVIQPLREDLTTLKAENAELRAKLAAKEAVE